MRNNRENFFKADLYVQKLKLEEIFRLAVRLHVFVNYHVMLHRDLNQIGDERFKFPLSNDIKTYKAVRKAFGKRFTESCYMRPDFLYNYISLAPGYDQASSAFAELCPTLFGVNISFRVPQEVSSTISVYMKEHAGLPLASKRAVLRRLADKLKTDSTLNMREHVTTFLDKLCAESNH